MTEFPYSSALIVGAGPGLSASLARQLAECGVKVALAARNTDKLNKLAGETGALTFAADAAQPASVAALFDDVAAAIGAPEVVIYNASGRLRGALAELDPAAVEQAIAISAYGGFLVSQQAARRMLAHGRGAILFTGATASIKGYAESAAFAMGKFALRGLAQSAARELGPKGIHVAHFIIDGGIRSQMRREDPAKPDATLDPGAIARTYINVLLQHRSAWSQEIEMRPWTESF
ncbi:SDR family NAD(P)-dependent oxidoreductase [Rhizobium mesoamericanum]|uniref:Short-chain dehydrogenase/reductase SDR n=1 Tax=Rhizobium mesoamericanum STM3625 TaxID=1211777 RepID=K0PWY4_9HYPH|nr:SDR family NAD(P)-dependent oxidoreductase [Rhizobium mesoamericanum]CCM74339.1 Short-chain dehydrogenase/reductase SDR [Rhizobium mesoamericanum STM3625]